MNTGCSLSGLIPELAKDAGEPTSHVQAVIHPSKTRSLPPGIDGVQIEVLDVLIRRKTDQSWNILNDKPAVWTIGATAHELPTFSAVPLAIDDYDGIKVVFGRAFVAQNGTQSPLEIPGSQVTQEGAWNLSRDQGFHLWLNLTDAIQQDAQGQWQATPNLELLTKNADFSGESIKKDKSTAPNTNADATSTQGQGDQNTKVKGGKKA